MVPRLPGTWTFAEPGQSLGPGRSHGELQFFVLFSCSSEENIPEGSCHTLLWNLVACFLGTGLTLIAFWLLSFLGEILYLNNSRVQWGCDRPIHLH